MLLEQLDEIKKKLLNIVSEEEHDLRNEIDKVKRPEDVLRIMRNYKKKLSLRNEIGGFDSSITRNLIKLRALYIDLYKDELQEKMLDEHAKQILKENNESLERMNEEREEYRENLAEWNREFQSEFGEFIKEIQDDNEKLQNLEEGLEQDRKELKDLDQQIEQEQERLLNSSELQEQENKLNQELDQMLHQLKQSKVVEQTVSRGEEVNKETLAKKEQVLGQSSPKPAMEQIKLEEAQGKKEDLDRENLAKQRVRLMQQAQIQSTIEQNRAAAPKPEPKPILRNAIKKALKIKGMSQLALVGVADLQQKKNDFFKNIIAEIKNGLISGDFKNINENLKKQIEKFTNDLSQGAIFKQFEKNFDKLFQMDEKKKKLEMDIKEKTKSFEEQVKLLLNNDDKDPDRLSKFVFNDQFGEQLSKSGNDIKKSATGDSDSEYKSPTPFATKLEMTKK